MRGSSGVTISFDLREGVAIGTAVAEVQRVADRSCPSITTSFAGTAQAFQSSQAGLLALLILAVLVIYMVLGILYESFIHRSRFSRRYLRRVRRATDAPDLPVELSVYAFVASSCWWGS